MVLADEEQARKSEAALRTVPLAGPLLRRLQKEWNANGRPREGRVGPARRRSKSGMLALGQLQSRVRRTWLDQDLKPIGLQDSRHTAATWLDHAGVSPKAASVFMGRRVPRRHYDAAAITLNRYTHILPGELERARDQLDSFLERREKDEEVRTPRSEKAISFPLLI